MQYSHLFGQWTCLKSYEMLLQLLRTDYPVEFEYSSHGKPYISKHILQSLQTPYSFFSISHCQQAVAVAVSGSKIGIDVESRTRRISDGLAESVMNESEQQYIARHPEPDTPFIELWTKKEAVLKQRGTGIIDDMRSVLTGSEQIETYIFDTYIMSICSA